VLALQIAPLPLNELPAFQALANCITGGTPCVLPGACVVVT